MSLSLLGDVFESDLPPSERLVALALANHADEEGVCWPSVKRIIACTGLTKRTILRSLDRLEETGWLIRQKRLDALGRNRSNVYGFTRVSQCHRRVSERHPGRVSQCHPESLREEPSIEPKTLVGSPNGEPDAADSAKTSPAALAVLAAAKEHGLPWRKPHKFLLGRLNEGATVEDCAAVIAFKCADWRGTDMEQYLRQETLFRGSHFEGYLLGARKWQEKERTLVRVFEREEATQNWQETRCGHEGPDGRRCLRDKGHTDLWRSAGKRHADSNGFWED